MEYLLPYLHFTNYEIAGLIIFFLLFCLQIRFYLVYYRKPYMHVTRKADYEVVKHTNIPKVSVIVVSENESEKLKENLPHILKQDYPDFEVVVVNKGSTDETDDLLNLLSHEYPNLYSTYIPNSTDDALNNKKLAITVGIKAANGSIVLFTEPYSHPVSDQWINSMVKNLYGEKEITLGYSSIATNYTFFNRLIRFDNYFFSMQYLSLALQGKSYGGTFRNIAFKKQLFFDHKGFAATLGKTGGEEIFLHDIQNDRNTSVALEQEAFVETDVYSPSLWREMKKTFSYAKTSIGKYATLIFPIEYASRYAFHLCFIALVVSSCLNQNWVLLGATSVLWIAREIYQFVILNKSSKYFNSLSFGIATIIYELIQPIQNMKYRSRQKSRFK